MDLFTVTCLKCGHSFGLSDKELFEMKACSCPNCGQRMSNWTFFDLKRAYFDAVIMMRDILSLGPFAPEAPNFTFAISGDQSESEDARLLRFMLAVFDKPTASAQDNIDKEGEINT